MTDPYIAILPLTLAITRRERSGSDCSGRVYGFVGFAYLFY